MKLFSVLLTALAIFASASQADAARVVKLGQTQLSYGTDYDFVNVNGTCHGPRNKRVERILLQIRKNDADIDYIAVQYGNGVVDRLSVREYFRQGSSSRWIDLRGGERCVKGIAIIGETLGFGPKALVEIFGLDY